MAQFLAKLMLLLAVLLMPLGMASPAAAAAGEHHGAIAAMPMEHCPEDGSEPEAGGALAQCTMACSAALPAMDAPPPLRPVIVCAPLGLPLARVLSGVPPETATPPPKPL